MLGSRKWFFLLALFGMMSVLINALAPYFFGTGVSDWTVVTSANQFFKETVAAIIGGLLALETRDGHTRVQQQPDAPPAAPPAPAPPGAEPAAG